MNEETKQNNIEHLLGGYFEYFRGGIVRLDLVATDWETKELMVIYTEVSNNTDCKESKIWVRHACMFFGYVEDKEKNIITRFKYLGKSNSGLNKSIIENSTRK